LNRHSKFFYYNDINKEYPFFISKLFFSVQIVVRFAVPAKKGGTVGTVPTVPGATAVHVQRMKSNIDVQHWQEELDKLAILDGK
jgi:hypothetical protein